VAHVNGADGVYLANTGFIGAGAVHVVNSGTYQLQLSGTPPLDAKVIVTALREGLALGPGLFATVGPGDVGLITMRNRTDVPPGSLGDTSFYIIVSVGA
jgi:hypothetical protein